MKMLKYSSAKILLFLVCCFLMLHTIGYGQNSTVKKAVFQAFWWDYWNANYPNGWSNYLCELAPRLKAAGFDAVWIPPSYKNSSTGSVGYAPFDQYDLGDKFQKGGGTINVKTRMGTKDEYLRMIAVMHANGLEVIQDVVLNHTTDAGTNSGTGGQDPEATYSMQTASGYKNFRYVSYATPLIDESSDDYWTRSGRWSKNYWNFHPNASDNCVSGDICESYWGPDISYLSGSAGQSSNIPSTGNATIGATVRPYYNPVQANNYMRDNARQWIVWLKKQTGVDGWRWDAVKHFDINVQEDFIYNSKYVADFANGDQNMFCVGEWIGNKTELDNYMWNVRTGTAPNGVTNELSTGTFDFSMRGYGYNGGLYSMVLGMGGYNMQNIPGEQQDRRYMDYPGGKRVYRTVPFVNSHDTYRPKLDADGNFSKPLGDASGWDTGNELGGNGQHIDPREPRLAAAYAAICAIDGNPAFFFEDIFDIGTTGKRWTHLPSSTSDLPVRSDLQNILQAHQKLDFKNGSYAVPSSLADVYLVTGDLGDHLVIDRIGKAIIGISDSYDTDQEVWVTVDDSWVGKTLYDYSGAHGISTSEVYNDRRVLIKTACVGHTIADANGHGYSIWAPAPEGVTVTSVQDLYDHLATYSPSRSAETTQEWEMADDLGDSHCQSLGQGGKLPASSTNQRVAGKIFVAGGETITYKVFPEVNNTNVTTSIWNLDGTKLHEMSGVTSTASPLTGVFTSSADGWITVKIRNTTNTQSEQKCWINVTYTAPQVVNTLAPENSTSLKAAIWTGNKGSSDITDCGNWEEGQMPGAAYNLIIPANAKPAPVFTNTIQCNDLWIEDGTTATINSGVNILVNGETISGSGTFSGEGSVILAGNALQNITGAIAFNKLEIANANNVQLNASIKVNDELILTNGKLQLGNYNLQLSPATAITGGSNSSYIQTLDVAAGAGSVEQQVGSESKLFPVGNSTYTPVIISNSGTLTNFNIRVFESVLSGGTSGSPVSTGVVNKSWIIEPEIASGVNVNATFQWNASDQSGDFVNSLAKVMYSNAVAGWTNVSSVTGATGSGPYLKSENNIPSFHVFAVYSDNVVLPVTLTGFTGLYKNNVVELKWTTTSEYNNKGFKVLRSEDGKTFLEIGFVDADKEENTTIKNYSFTDDDINTSKLYYRLQQVDNDGRVSNHKIIEVITNLQPANMIMVKPNPVRSSVEVLSNYFFNGTEKIGLEVFTMDGSKIAGYTGSFSYVKDAAKNVLLYQSSGMYVFIVKYGSNIQRIKVARL